MPSTTSVSLTGNPDIDGLLSSSKWADPNITFSFPTLMSQYGYSKTGFEALNTAQQTATRAILDMIESYTGLNFTEVTESSSVHGTLRFAEEDNAGTAYAYFPTSVEQGGDVWLNHTNYNDPLRGSYAYMTLMHEIGHGLGLDHGHDGAAALPTNHDSLEYSVMTYRSFVGGPIGGYTARSGSYPTTLMLDDVAALQYLYGANYSTNAGNTTYSWSATTGAMSVNGAVQGASTANKIFMTLWDGGGIDTYDFSNYTTNLSVDLGPGGWTTTSSAQLADLGQSFYPGKYARGNIANAYLYNNNTASLIENAKGGIGNDTIVGNQANNTLWGGDGDDRLTGAAGNDIIHGGNGVDYCIVAVNYATCTITYDSSTLTFLLSSALGIDTVSGVEYFTFLDGTYAAASLTTPGSTTDTAAPTLTSMTPADNASSVAANANLVLNFNESVVAGAGSIIIRTSTGTIVATIAAADAAQVSISGGTVTINPTSDLAQGQSYYVTIGSDAFRDAASNYYAGISSSTAFNFSTVAAPTTPPPVVSTTINGTSSANTLNGTSGNDTINGLGGNDTINGQGGNDTIDGGTGQDRMAGGAGDDTYIVDNTSDRVTESSGQGTDTIKSSVSFTLGSNVEHLTLTGSSNVTATGNTSANVLIGNTGNNTLSGSSGNDTLSGKLGVDTLSGGSGRDTFVFDTTLSSGNIDRISDFNVSDDTIALSRSVFASLALGSVSSTAFYRGSSAADASDRLVYNSSTGALYYDPDGVGGTAQQQIATLSKGLGLTAADFLIIA